MNIKILLRLEQICSSLQSEGWVFVGKYCTPKKTSLSVVLRHRNGSRITIRCNENEIKIFKNKKLIKTELLTFNHFPYAKLTCHPVT